MVEKKEEDITHHGCGVAGAPSGLRSLSLLPGWEQTMALGSHSVSHGQRHHGHLQPGSSADREPGREQLAHLGMWCQHLPLHLRRISAELRP